MCRGMRHNRRFAVGKRRVLAGLSGRYRSSRHRRSSCSMMTRSSSITPTRHQSGRIGWTSAASPSLRLAWALVHKWAKPLKDLSFYEAAVLAKALILLNLCAIYAPTPNSAPAHHPKAGASREQTDSAWRASSRWHSSVLDRCLRAWLGTRRAPEDLP